MKRKALAVAVGALFVAPVAQAQITFGNDQVGTLQIYGKLYPQLAFSSSNGATTPGTTVSTLTGTTATNPACPGTGSANCTGINPQPRTTVDVQNSYIGFRGERGLGRGLKAIWQIETATNFDNGTGTWASRNSFAGLSSAQFGTVKLGNMDTVYKEYGDTFSMFGISSGNFVSASNMLSHIGIGNNRTARFHERRTNSIMYETPSFANITAGVMYGPDEAKTGAVNANLWSYGVKWDTEKFYASVHQEIHKDFFGGSNNIPITALQNTATAGAHSRDKATRFSAEFRGIPNHRFVVDVARLQYRESGQAPGVAKFQEYKHTNWAIGWDGGFGPWRFAVQYIQGGEGTCKLTIGDCSTDGLKGKQLNGGVRYRFDRQTFVYFIASRLTNDKSARYNNWAADNPTRGSHIDQVALGVSYTF